MANVTGKALRDFKYKGELVNKGDAVTMPAHHAATYSNIDYIKLDSEATHKVEAFTESQVDETGTTELTREDAPAPAKRGPKKK
jgi:hypothetical protein